MHPSIVEEGYNLKPKILSPSEFGCPLCPSLTTISAPAIQRHLLEHEENAVRFDEKIICKCNLPCRGGGHFHCPFCGTTVMRQRTIETHIVNCKNQCNAAKLASLPPSQSPTPETHPEADLTSMKEEQSFSPPPSPSAMRVECVYSLSESSETPAFPPEEPDVYQSPLAATSEEPIAPVNRLAAVLPQTHVQCPHCQVVLTKMNLLIHIKRKHRKVMMHASIVEKDHNLRPKILSPYMFGCPLCPMFTTKRARIIQRHLLNHEAKGVHFNDKIICRCKLPCRGQSHFHCPFCGTTVMQQRTIRTHIVDCKYTCGAAQPRPILPSPSPSSETHPAADLTSASVEHSFSPPSAPSPMEVHHAHTQTESPEIVVIIPEEPEVSPSPPAATTGVPIAQQKRLARILPPTHVLCPHCPLVLNKRKLLIHIQRKHNKVLVHPSIVKAGYNLKPKILSPFMFGCPLCPMFTTKRAIVIQRHLLNHEACAVHFKDKTICKCNLPCRGRGHFHCPFCGTTIMWKSAIRNHIVDCKKKCGAARPRPILPSPSPSSATYPAADLTSMRVEHSLSPASAPSSMKVGHAHTQIESPKIFIFLPVMPKDPEVSPSPPAATIEEPIAQQKRLARILPPTHVLCPHCPLVLNKRNLLIHIQRKHEGLVHPSILEEGYNLNPKILSPFMFGCPLCPKFTTKRPRAMQRHLMYHEACAVHFKDKIICSCHLTCRNGGHFHCPFCGITMIQKEGFRIHIGDCKSKCDAVQLTSVPPSKSPPSETHPAADLTSMSVEQSVEQSFSQPPSLSAVRGDHTYTQSESSKTPASPPAEPEEPDVSQSSPAATSEEAIAPEDQMTGVVPRTYAKCPHCPDVLNKINLFTHIHQKHGNVLMQPSIVKEGSNLRPKTLLPSSYGCPLCPTFTTRGQSVIQRHLLNHEAIAVRFEDKIICRCNLSCRDGGHFHCPFCGITIINKHTFASHIGDCKCRYDVAQRASVRASLPPSQSPTPETHPAADLTAMSVEHSFSQPPSPLAVRGDHAYSQSESPKTPASPPAEPEEPDEPDVSQSPPAATSEEAIAPEDQVYGILLPTHIECPYCPDVLKKINLSLHIQQKHDEVLMHPSIVEEGYNLRPKTLLKSSFGCPLCPRFTTRVERVIQRHLLNHEENAVRFKEKMICRCKLSCRREGHFHCPLCGITLLMRGAIVKHVVDCNNKYHAAQLASVRDDHAYSQTESPKTPASPPAEPEEPDVSQSPPGATSVEPIAPKDYLPPGRVKCPHCPLVLYKRNLSVHIRRKHEKPKDITAQQTLQAPSVDQSNDLHAAGQTASELSAPVYEQCKTCGQQPMAICEMEGCGQDHLVSADPLNILNDKNNDPMIEREQTQSKC